MGPDDDPAPGDRGLIVMDEWMPTESDLLPEDLVYLIKPELEPGERLLWASRPGLRVQKEGQGNYSGFLIWLVGMMILSVGCLFGGQLRGPRFEAFAGLLSVIGVISGVIDFLILLGLLSSLVSDHPDRTSLAHQVYALTDRRAIIRMTDPKTLAVTVNSFHQGTIKSEDIHRVQYPDGSGNVVFRGYGEPPGFLDVAEVQRVEGLIRRFLIAPTPGSTP
jgi:hypothetical protein